MTYTLRYTPMDDLYVFSFGKMIDNSELATQEIEDQVRKEFAPLHADPFEIDVLSRLLSPEIPHVGGVTTKARFSHEITVDGTIPRSRVPELILAKRGHYVVLNH